MDLHPVPDPQSTPRRRRAGTGRSLLAAILIGVLIAACGDGGGAADGPEGTDGTEGDGAAASGEEIVLEFPSWQANEPGNAAVFQAIIDEFESRHDNVTVDLYHVSNDDFQNQMVTRLAAGDPPDIIASGNHFHAFAATGQLEPLNDRLEASGILDEWQDFQQDRVVGGDHLALALHAHTRILHFNRAYLEAAGLSEPPSNPDELRAAVEAIDEAGLEGVSAWGATTTSHSNLFGESTAFIVGMGSQWITDGQWSVTAPATVEAIDLYRELIRHAPPGLDGGGYRQLLADGRIAMAIDGNWVLAFIDGESDEEIRGDIEAAVTPLESSVAALGTSLSIPAGISDERKDLVWEFIEIAAQPEFQGMWAEAIDAVPGRIGSIDEGFVEERPEIAVVEANIDKARPEFPDSENFRASFGEIEQRIIDAMMRLHTTDDPTADVLAELEQQLMAITDP